MQFRKNGITLFAILKVQKYFFICLAVIRKSISSSTYLLTMILAFLRI